MKVLKNKNEPHFFPENIELTKGIVCVSLFV